MAVENPPAFPRLGEGFGSPKYDEPGMSLRDWFAGQALSSIGAVEGYADHAALAADVYAVADAMLAQRAEASNG